MSWLYKKLNVLISLNLKIVIKIECLADFNEYDSYFEKKYEIQS